MLSTTFSVEEFSTRRRKAQDDALAIIQPLLGEHWSDDLEAALLSLWTDIYSEESGSPIRTARGYKEVFNRLEAAYEKAKEREPREMALMLVTAVINAATVQAANDDPEDLFLEWVSMSDGAVRHTHKEAHGQVRPIGEPFKVGATELPYPGYPVAEVEEWLNCRCVARPTLASEFGVRTANFAADVARRNPPLAERIKNTPADEPLDEPTHAGLAVYAADSGRILMLQRTWDETDAPDVRGTWEFPGGGIEEGETPQEAAEREFCEETGLAVPTGDITNGWRSPDGVYQGFILTVPIEADAFEELNPDLAAAETINPDDPERRMPDVTAWFTIDQIKNLGPALRPEVAKTDWSLFDRQENDMTTEAPEQPTEQVAASDGRVPWHGPLVVDDTWSGDKRKFAKDAIDWRPFPLPLTWQKVSAEGHDGNITTAMIEEAYYLEDTGQTWAYGHFLQSVPEADEEIGLLGEFGRFGVSIDADSSTFELDETEEGIVFTSARGCGACVVPIPAFAEAWVSLGELPEDIRKKGRPLHQPPVPVEAPKDQAPGEKPTDADVPEEDMIKPPADISEEDRKRLVASGLFADVAPGRTEDGPGWITNPVPTDRLRDYWSHGEGAAKIGWGTPGDFNRCRVEVAAYVKPQHLNGYCANRHFDALGFWPGRPVAGDTTPFAYEALGLSDDTATPALTLVASGIKAAEGGGFCAPAEWFKDPEFAEGDGRMVEVEEGVWACPPTFTKDGEVFGHLASWQACHLNWLINEGVCVAPPHSNSNYAYMRNGGVVPLDDGTNMAVGQLTLGGGHAGERLSLRAAKEHYDESGAAICDIVVGEDAFGIWYHGWVRPGTTDEQIAAARASAYSGDWREVPRGSGNFELVAACAVNTAGYGIPRPRVGFDEVGQVSLVAAGVIPPREETVDQVESELSAQGLDLDTLAAKIVDQMEARAAAAAEAEATISQVLAETESLEFA